MRNPGIARQSMDSYFALRDFRIAQIPTLRATYIGQISLSQAEDHTAPLHIPSSSLKQRMLVTVYVCAVSKFLHFQQRVLEH